MTGRIEQLAEGVTLYLGDCREILPSLGTVDATIFDPPYEAVMHKAKAAGRGRSLRRVDGGPALKSLDFQAVDGMRLAIAGGIGAITQGWFLAFCCGGEYVP